MSNKFKVTVEKEDGNNFVVAIEPLEQGYGHTLGNALRRTLLSSIPGAAITSVKITGVNHQFSTITGVVEDVIEIILNLKKVRVKVFADAAVKNKTFRMSVNKSGLGPITAADIDTQGQGEISNPEQHIATITDSKVKFLMEMTVETGMGYVPTDDKRAAEIGLIPVDAIFTPILSVNYTVEQTRVGRRTDFDKLNLEIVTDGTITAVDAVTQAARVLAGMFRQVYEPSTDDEIEAPVASTAMLSNDLLRSSVEELDLPVRISNALKAIDIDTIDKLVSVQRVQLIKAKNLGAKSLSLISEKLGERGLALSEA